MHPTRIRRSALPVALVLALVSLSVLADTIIVAPPGTIPPPDFNTIQEAIDTAVDGDEILVAAGTYGEVIDCLGKAIALRSEHGPDVTTIDGTGLNDSVVKCVSGEGSDTLFDGFTITGNIGPNAGMKNMGSSPTVSDCVFIGDLAAGVSNLTSSPTVSDSSPTFNQCSFIGIDGIAMGNGSSDPTVTNCSFIGNRAGMVSISLPLAGANTSDPTVINCLFDNNSPNGAMEFRSNSRSIPVVSRCVFVENSRTSAVVPCFV